MRTFSTVAIFALALTGANAAVYTGDGAVTQSGVVTVGDPAACPVRLPAQSSLFCVGRFASVSVTTRAPARGARGICSRRERARASATNLRDTRAPLRSPAADLPSPPPFRRVADRVHLRGQLHRRLLHRFPRRRDG